MTTEVNNEFKGIIEDQLPSAKVQVEGIDAVDPNMQAVLNPREPIEVSQGHVPQEELLTKVENATTLCDLEIQASGGVLAGLLSAGCKMADDISGVSEQVQEEVFTVAPAPAPASEPVNHYNRDFSGPNGPMGM